MFEQWSEPLYSSGDRTTIVADSAYVAGIVMWLKHSYPKETTNVQLFALLLLLKRFLDHRSESFFIQLVRSHSSLSGPISEGNAQVDKLAGAVIIPDQFAQTQLSHNFYYQNAKA